jgi:hypothetical protein
MKNAVAVGLIYISFGLIVLLALAGWVVRNALGV